MEKKKYLHEVDLMRVIFIFGVLLNHVTSAISQRLNNDTYSAVFMDTTHLSLHFTRMGFMFMTGLVLTLNYYHKEPHWPAFWKKRYWSVGVPYLAWNALLLLFVNLVTEQSQTGSEFFSTWVQYVRYGDHFYLYYLLVTMQLYLLFPLLMKLFKKYPQNHLMILLGSILLQFFLLLALKYWLPHVDTANWWYLFRYYGNNVLVYQVYFVAGAFTSIHYQKVERFIMRHARLIGYLTLCLALGTILLYVGDIRILNLSNHAAHSAHQPYILVYALTMIAFVFYLGRKYAYWREHGLWQQVDLLIKLGSKLSFGVYLVQTIPLTLLAYFLAQIQIAAWLLVVLTPLFYLLTVTASLLIAWLLYRIPPFGVLVGRSNIHKLKKEGVKNVTVK